ncbi:MAG: YceD family protein [Anaerolineae bacterium]
MRFNVAQLLKSPAGASREYELDEDITDIDEDLDIVSTLVGRVRFLRTGEGILVTGHLQTEILIPCRRCLTPVAVSIELDLEEQFRPSVDILTGAILPLEAGEDEATRTDLHHILDLTEVVRQNLLLGVPMAPLCRPQCRGLCPQCGKNLNEGPCGCQQEESDPRLMILHGLL